MPFVISFLLYIIWLIWNWQMTFYIQEIDMYVIIENTPFSDVKMYFSKSKNFGSDYVKYNNSSDIVYLDIYYTPPHTISVIGASGTKEGKFHIIECEKRLKYHKQVISPNTWVPDYYYEYSDSTFIKEPSYHFSINDYFSGFYLEDPHGKIIYKAGTER